MCDNELEILESVAYIKESKHRTNMILLLNHGLCTPTEIGHAINLRPNHTSNILSDLRKKDLVYCATPNIRKGKLYTLTDDGKSVLNYIKSEK